MIAIELTLEQAVGLLDPKATDASAQTGREKLERAVMVEVNSGGNATGTMLPSWMSQPYSERV